jgi:hypothetical protein
LLVTYANAVEQSQAHFRSRHRELIGQTLKWLDRWKDDTPEGEEARRVEAGAALNMARDLGYYREQARNIGDGVKDGRFNIADGIARMNSVLGELTGLREFFDHLAKSVLTEVEHARLDTGVEVLQEDSATKLIHAVDIMFGKTVVFEASNGGPAYKDWTLTD